MASEGKRKRGVPAGDSARLRRTTRKEATAPRLPPPPAAIANLGVERLPTFKDRFLTFSIPQLPVHLRGQQWATAAGATNGGSGRPAGGRLSSRQRGKPPGSVVTSDPPPPPIYLTWHHTNLYRNGIPAGALLLIPRILSRAESATGCRPTHTTAAESAASTPSSTTRVRSHSHGKIMDVDSSSCPSAGSPASSFALSMWSRTGWQRLDPRPQSVTKRQTPTTTPSNTTKTPTGQKTTGRTGSLRRAPPPAAGTAKGSKRRPVPSPENESDAPAKTKKPGSSAAEGGSTGGGGGGYTFELSVTQLASKDYQRNGPADIELELYDSCSRQILATGIVRLLPLARSADNARLQMQFSVNLVPVDQQEGQSMGHQQPSSVSTVSSSRERTTELSALTTPAVAVPPAPLPSSSSALFNDSTRSLTPASPALSGSAKTNGLSPLLPLSALVSSPSRRLSLPSRSPTPARGRPAKAEYGTRNLRAPDDAATARRTSSGVQTRTARRSEVAMAQATVSPRKSTKRPSTVQGPDSKRRRRRLKTDDGDYNDTKPQTDHEHTTEDHSDGNHHKRNKDNSPSKMFHGLHLIARAAALGNDTDTESSEDMVLSRRGIGIGNTKKDSLKQRQKK